MGSELVPYSTVQYMYMSLSRTLQCCAVPWMVAILWLLLLGPIGPYWTLLDHPYPGQPSCWVEFDSAASEGKQLPSSQSHHLHSIKHLFILF